MLKLEHKKMDEKSLLPTTGVGEKLDLLYHMAQIEIAGIIPQASADIEPATDRIQSIVDELLEGDNAEAYKVLRTRLLQLGMAVSKSKSKNKKAFIANLLLDPMRSVVRQGLELALNCDEFSEFVETAKPMLNDPGLEQAAKEFMEVAELKEQTYMSGDVQFQAADELINRLASGKNYLYQSVLEIADDMADVYRSPGTETPEEWIAQKQRSRDILLKLASLGIVHPVLLKIGEDMANVYRSPVGETPEEKKAEQQQALQIIIQLATVGIQVPGFQIKFNVHAPKEENAEALPSKIRDLQADLHTMAPVKHIKASKPRKEDE